MRSELVTDEMVEEAARAEWTHEWPIRPWEKVPDDLADHYRDCSRHALEAAAPAIAAKALREFGRWVDDECPHEPDEHAEGSCEVCDYAFAVQSEADARADRIRRGES